jgi:hypothetical protein
MDCDSVEKLLIEMSAERCASVAFDGDQRLESGQRLNRALEADRSRFQAVLRRRLGHDCADEIVGQDVGPDLFPHQLRRLAAQHLYLQGGLEGSQIKFRIPPTTVELREIVFRECFRVQERRGNDEAVNAKPWLVDPHTALANCQRVGERGVSLAIDGARLGRLGPNDNVIACAQTSSSPEVCLPVLFESADRGRRPAI